MFSTLNFIVGSITAEQQDNKIILGGFSTRRFFKQLKVMYGTRIQSGLIYRATMTRIEMPIFFAYDFMVIMEQVLIHGKGHLFSKQSAIDIVKALKELPIFKKLQIPVRSKLSKKVLEKFHKSPLEHQTEFYRNYDGNTQRYQLKGLLLNSAAGTGKTFMALSLSEMLGTVKTVIFSPNNALERVWQTGFHVEYKEAPSYYVYGVTKPPKGDERFWVFSHENLKFAFETIKAYFKRGIRVNIVIDECHAFNDMKSNRTQLLIEICKYLQCEDTLFMSGTPFKAMGSEILPFLWVCDPYFDEDSEERFKKVFGANGNTALDVLAARIGRSSFTVLKEAVVVNKRYEIDLKIKIPNGHEYTMSAIRVKMQKFIRERAAYYQSAAPRMEAEYLSICAQFKLTLDTSQEKAAFASYQWDVEIIRNTINLRDISDVIVRANAYENKFMIPRLSNEQKKTFRDVRSVYKYVSLKIQGEALGRILGKERERCNVDMLKGLDTCTATCEELGWDNEPFSLADIFGNAKAKAIFFTDFVEVVTEAGRMFTAVGMKPMLVYGETNKDLSKIIQAVEKDPKANPIVATYKSLSTAVPLTALDTCVFLCQPFRDYIKTQAEARLDRIGQQNELLYYNVILDTGAEVNISSRSLDIMNWSKEQVELLMGTKLSDDPEVIEQSLLEALDEQPIVKLIRSTLGW